MKRVYAITVEDGEITDLVYEILTCKECSYYNTLSNPRTGKTWRICHHPGAMVEPSPDGWCSYGREKDHE